MATYAICTGVTRIPDGRDYTTAATLEKKSQRAFGMSVRQSSHSTIADAAAKHVALVFDHEDAVCLMHVNDIFAKAAIGGLVRKKDRKVVNLFLAGQFLVKKVHAVAIYFSYSTSFDNMMQKAESVLEASS